METAPAITIRRAAVADVDSVAPLFDAYRQFYECPADIDLARGYLHARLGRDESIVFIAETDAHETVGFTQLYPTFCSVEAGPIFVLYDLFVADSWRGHRVGHALLAQAERFGGDQKAIRLDLATATTNRTAQALYEKHGWERDDRFFHYSLHLPHAN